MVFERLGWEPRESAAVRLTSSRWRRIHDEGRKTLELCDLTRTLPLTLTLRLTLTMTLRLTLTMTITLTLP